MRLEPCASILVLYAVSGEREALNRGLLAAGAVQEGQDPDPWVRGLDFRLGQSKVRLASIGLSARRLALAWPPGNPSPDAALLVGLAGGLDPRLGIGETFLIDKLADSSGVIPVPGAAGILTASLNRSGLEQASLWTSQTLVCTPAAKADLRRRTGASLVDMESSIVVREAASRGVPIAVVRTVVDAADDALPLDFTRLVRSSMDDRLDPRKLFAALLKKPWAILHFSRLREAGGIASTHMQSSVQAIFARFVAAGGSPSSCEPCEQAASRPGSP